MSSKREDYFAINLDIDELMGLVDKYYNDLNMLGYLDKIKISYAQYYGKGIDAPTHKITINGESGELSSLSVNNYRALLRHQYTLVTSDRLAYDVRPINTDYTSMAQALLGNDVLEYYLIQKKLENILKRATEKSLWSSEGFVSMSWDADLGNIYAADDNGDPIMEGDISYRTHSTLDVIRDIYKEESLDWQILRIPENRYELAASFPEFEDEIMDIPSVVEGSRSSIAKSTSTSMDTDMIDFFILYHRKSKALPEGKYAYFVDGQILSEGPLPYSDIPVYRITPAEHDGFCLGYTQGFDILGLQHGFDQLFEAVLSNNITFSRQCIQAPRAAAVNVQDLADGMKLFEYDGDQPLQPLTLVNSSPETYKLMDMMQSLKEQLTGINEVVRGDPSANLRSGNSMALIAAQAIKFNSSLQYSYAKLTEDVGTATLQFLKDFAEAPRFISVVGKHNKAYLKEFNKDKLQGVSKVEVETASALSKTMAGRIEMANNLLQNGLIKRPEQYLAVMETGKLEPMIEAEQTELLNIKGENERLREGQEAVAVILDDHRLHILEHKAVINDPDARENPEIVQMVLNHIQEHLAQWKQISMTPEIAMALSIQPIQPQQPPMGAPAPDGSAPQPESGVSPEVLEQNPQEAMPGMPSLPDVPPEASQEDAAALEQLNLEPPPQL